MYTRLILAVQVVLFLSQPVQAALPFHNVILGAGMADLSNSEKSFEVVDDSQLKKYVNQNVSQIELISRSSLTAKTKLAQIHERVSLVSEFRSRNWSKSAFVEQQLDLEIKPFESFPTPQNFRRDRCSQYQARIAVDWEPLASDFRSVQSGVARALRVLKEICST